MAIIVCIHVTEFDKLKYVYMAVDRYSGFLMATTQTKKVTEHVMTLCLECSACMGVPEFIGNRQWIWIF